MRTHRWYNIFCYIYKTYLIHWGGKTALNTTTYICQNQGRNGIDHIQPNHECPRFGTARLCSDRQHLAIWCTECLTCFKCFVRRQRKSYVFQATCYKPIVYYEQHVLWFMYTHNRLIEASFTKMYVWRSCTILPRQMAATFDPMIYPQRTLGVFWF